ncbi:MAG: Wadjet anti-phage system protein JetD domain-containing protein [Balneolales bacterium]
MITSREIEKKALRKYPGYLEAVTKGESIFPLSLISDKKPSGGIGDLQKELNELLGNAKVSRGYGYSVEMAQIATRRFGRQDLPSQIYFDTEEDYLRFTRKEKEVKRFKQNIALIRKHLPELEEWLECRGLSVIKYENAWPELLKVCRYFKNNPSPGLYVRQLPIAVHTKFIESHYGILTELLNVILRDHHQPGEKVFEKRFNLKYSEPLVRFLLLDGSLGEQWFSGMTDLSLPVSGFNRLRLPVNRVIIVENKVSLYTALTLPPQRHAMAIFGSGFSVENLKEAHWLHDTEILYWGDLDAHGFQILSQVRKYFPHTVSMLMDVDTFERFNENSIGKPSKVKVLPNLSEAEHELYKRIQKDNLRLEQEKIPNDYVVEYIEKLEMPTPR